MAKKIIDMVHLKSQSMQKDNGEAERNALLAAAAIKGGMGSPAWRAYMIQFVEQEFPGSPADPRQLNRLMGIDESRDLPDMDRKRAYLVGNGPCGETTPTIFPANVDSIDDGLAVDCKPSPGILTARPANQAPIAAKKKSPKKKAAKKKAAKKKAAKG